MSTRTTATTAPGPARLAAWLCQSQRSFQRRLQDRGTLGSVIRILAFRGLTVVMNLVSGIVVTKALGPEGRGVLAALLLAPQFVSSLIMFGLPTGLVYLLKANELQAPRYFGAALMLGLPSAALAAVLTWTIIPFWFAGYDADIVTIARTLLLILPFGGTIPLLTGVLEARGRFGLVGAILYAQPLGCVLLLLPLNWNGLLTPTTAAVAYVLPVLLSFVLAAWFAVRTLQPRLNLARPFRQELLRYGSRRYGFEVLASLTTYLDQILVVQTLAPAEIGLYAIALSLSRMMGMMQDAVSSVLFPSIAGRPLPEIIAVLKRAVWASTALAVAGSSLVGLLASHLISLLYGPAFVAAASPFRLLLAGTILLLAVRMLGNIFTAGGQPGPVTVIEAVGVGTTLLAMVVLLRPFGVEGAAAAVLLGAVARLVCLLFCLRLILNVRIGLLLLPTVLMNRARS